MNLNFDSGLKIKWTTWTKYSLLWHNQLFACLENRLFLGQGKNKETIYHGFTELKVQVLGTGKTHRFCAHPSYRGGQGWNSWATVAWEGDDDQLYHFHACILTFFYVSPGQQGPPVAVVEFEPGDIYAMVQSASTWKKQSAGCSLVGSLNSHYNMERTVSIINAAAISSPVSVVEDKWSSNVGEEWLVDTTSAIMDPFLWINHFYDEKNRIG